MKRWNYTKGAHDLGDGAYAYLQPDEGSGWGWANSGLIVDGEHLGGSFTPGQLRGIYFLGLPWLHTWGSGRFSGVGRDAQYVVGKIQEALSAGRSAEGMELRALGS